MERRKRKKGEIEFQVIKYLRRQVLKHKWEDLVKEIEDKDLLAGMCDGRIHSIALDGFDGDLAKYKDIMMWCKRRLELDGVSPDPIMQLFLDDLFGDEPEEKKDENS
jgi:hypothetical protein